MSLESWKKEFYSPISKASKNKITAIEHSLQKWKGLLPVNLAKHEMVISANRDIYDRNNAELEINADSCSLCKYRDSLAYTDGNYCDKCPITIATGDSCDFSNRDYPSSERSPWRIWSNSHNPKPMIEVLEKTLKHFKKD